MKPNGKHYNKDSCYILSSEIYKYNTQTATNASHSKDRCGKFPQTSVIIC